MSSSASGPERTGAFRDAQAADPSAQPAHDPAVLEQVLDETLAMVQSNEALDPAEIEALMEVARQHRGQPLSLEPVAVDLVQALLRLRFSQLSNSDQLLRKMSLWVAATLLEDPQGEQRLQSLWTRLTELQG